MALNVTGGWTTGDDMRVIRTLALPFGSYTLACVQDCMNQLEVMSPAVAVAIRALLDQYEQAVAASSAFNMANTEGKTLIKADVLEWEPDGANKLNGPEKEQGRVRAELGQYFASCPCVGGYVGSGAYTTPLIRS